MSTHGSPKFDRRDSTTTINIRPFEPKDTDDVKMICFAHFRSLAPAAVMYFLSEHVQDLFVFLGCTKIFVGWLELLLLSIIFVAYLLIRARYEMECYIRTSCPDVDDISGVYMSDAKGHFWIAENPSKVSKSKKTPEILGCIGLVPYRGDHKVAQMMRLVVSVHSRRMRVGSRLLAQLELFAINNGYEEIRLYTNNLNANHMNFASRNGFETIQVVRRGLMRGDLIQWRKVLVKQEDPSALKPRRAATTFMD